MEIRRLLLRVQIEPTPTPENYVQYLLSSTFFLPALELSVSH